MLDFSQFAVRDAARFSTVDLPPGMTRSVEALQHHVPSAHQAGHVRLIDEHSPERGYSLDWLGERLGKQVARLDAALVATVLAEGLCSLAVQSFERYEPWVAELAEAIRETTGRRVSVTAFFTPPQSRGTAIHYDRADVFVVHLAGAKRWRVFDPIDHEPSSRTPYIDPAESPQPLRCCADGVLEPGDTLFLPTGWVHEVSNEYAAISVHLSFVIFSDSLLSVFGNVMTEAYSRLVRDHRWRERIRAQDLGRQEVEARLKLMLAEFGDQFMDAMAHHPQRFCDHLVLTDRLVQQRSDARATLALLDEEHDDMAICWVGGHHRAVLAGTRLELSTDSRSRYGVDPSLYEFCVDKRRFTTLEFAAAFPGRDDAITDFLIVMVRDLGLLSLSATLAVEAN